MSEEMGQQAADLRDIINSTFRIRFNNDLIKQNERAIARVKKECLNQDDFVVQITALATLVDDFDRDVLCLCLEKEFENANSIFLLEKLLEENNLRKGSIIKNLRFIKRIRATTFPIHRGGNEFLRLMRRIDFKPPFDWNAISKVCISLYLKSLTELYKQIDELILGITKERIERKEITDAR